MNLVKICKICCIFCFGLDIIIALFNKRTAPIFFCLFFVIVRLAFTMSYSSFTNIRDISSLPSRSRHNLDHLEFVQCLQADHSWSHDDCPPWFAPCPFAALPPKLSSERQNTTSSSALPDKKLQCTNIHILPSLRNTLFSYASSSTLPPRQSVSQSVIHSFGLA